LGFDPKRINLEYDVSNMRDKPPAELFGMRWAPCFTDLECASSAFSDRKDWSGDHLSDLGMHWLQPAES
jgi:hypothetical protein